MLVLQGLTHMAICPAVVLPFEIEVEAAWSLDACTLGCSGSSSPKGSRNSFGPLWGPSFYLKGNACSHVLHFESFSACFSLSGQFFCW